MIKEAVAEEESMQMTEDSLRRAAAGTPTNGISSETLEDGELEEESERAQEHSYGDSTGRLFVRGQRMQVLSYGNAHVSNRNPRLASSISSIPPTQALRWINRKSQACLTRSSIAVRVSTSMLVLICGEV